MFIALLYEFQLIMCLFIERYSSLNDVEIVFAIFHVFKECNVRQSQVRMGTKYVLLSH